MLSLKTVLFFLRIPKKKQKEEKMKSKFQNSHVCSTHITLAINNMHMHINIVSKILMSMKISKLLQVKYGRTTKIISIGRKMI